MNFILIRIVVSIFKASILAQKVQQHLPTIKLIYFYISTERVQRDKNHCGDHIAVVYQMPF